MGFPSGSTASVGALFANNGDNQETNTSYGVTTGTYLDIRQGYNATPDTSLIPPAKISRIFSHSTTGVSGDGAENLCGLSVNTAAINTSGVQAVGIYTGATNNNPAVGGGAQSDDACGLYAVGKILTGGGGIGMAICAIGTRLDTSAKAITTEQVFTINNSTTDQTYSPTVLSDCGLFLDSNGTKNAGTGILFNGGNPSQYDVGIGFMSNNSGGIKTTTIRDDSSSTTSIQINGTHTNGLDLSGGTFTGGEIKLGGGVLVLTGSGAPAVAAPVGSLYMRTNGGAGSTLYVKESGTGTTGWAAK